MNTSAIPVNTGDTGQSPDKALRERISELLQQKDAVLIAHYYTDEAIQEMAEQSGGYVSDSLDMARFGHEHKASTLVIAGVRFMGETAKILNPEKTVIMPDLEADCSLDMGCPPEQFAEFIRANPGRSVVVYANTSAAVKAQADWVVTSSNALDIVAHLHARGEKILFAPDRHLGAWIREQTGADMALWEGSCIIHDAFKADGLQALQQQHPEAATLVHPESPAAVVALADVVGSTTRLIKAAQELPNETLIVATDTGIFHKMQQLAPHKKLLPAPTAGVGATCMSCAHCPWMAMNSLEKIATTLERGGNEIHVDAQLREKALIPLQRMLEFAR